MKLIENLNNVYDEKEQNKNKHLFQQLFFLNFAMRVKKRKKSFEKFLTKFTFTINFLKLIDDEKITHLFRNLSNQLTKKIYHLNEVTKYFDYVKKVRQTINQMKIRNEIKQTTYTTTTKNRRREKSSRKNIEFKKIVKSQFKSADQIALKKMLSKLLVHIRNKFRKENKCFKCDLLKHMFFDSNVFCREKSQITKNKAEALLSKMKIK